MNAQLEDASQTGADWSGGYLKRGHGGGSGRLGSLVVRAGEIVTLDTDFQVFPLPGRPADLLGNGNPTTLTVTDGIFEFSSLDVHFGGTLRIVGDNPARVFVRGKARNLGRIDVSGGNGGEHDSHIANPSVELSPTAGGPGAGSGGFGADRYDYSAVQDMINIGAIVNIGADTNGRAGQGVAGMPANGGGLGGVQFPPEYPATISNTNGMLGGVGFAMGECEVRQVGGTGSGGAYATDGTAGVAVAPFPLTNAPLGLPTAPGPTVGGQSSRIGLAPPSIDSVGYRLRILAVAPNAPLPTNYLRGGSGGGGGGGHPYLTFGNGFPGSCLQFGAIFITWLDHSGASGGGGGGALQYCAGRDMEIFTPIDARGGAGGSAVPSGSIQNNGAYAMPGGGGSGGAVRLQAPAILFAGVGAVDVSGGVGGDGVWSDSAGGDGGIGLVRIEDLDPATDNATMAPRVIPFDPLEPTSVDYLSSSKWRTPRDRPESYSGATSCWMKPGGQFFPSSLSFEGDTGTRPYEMGWNMEVVYVTPQGNFKRVPFRGTNLTLPMPWEELYGNLMNHDQPYGTGSPVSIRFQGARLSPFSPGPHDLCDLTIDGAVPEVLEGSLTPWVEHPEELNTFSGPTPNMVRYSVVFDASAGMIVNQGDIVAGVTAVYIRTTVE